MLMLESFSSFVCLMFFETHSSSNVDKSSNSNVFNPLMASIKDDSMSLGGELMASNGTQTEVPLALDSL